MKRITWSITVFLALMGLSAAAGVWMSWQNLAWVVDAQRQILLMSRQRTLLHKIVKQAVLVEQTDLSEQSRVLLSMSAEEFDKILAGFIEGDESESIRKISLTLRPTPAPISPPARRLQPALLSQPALRPQPVSLSGLLKEELVSLQEDWNIFYDGIEILIAADERTPEFESALDAVTATEDALQEKLDRLVRTMQIDAEDGYQRLVMTESLTLLAIVLVIFVAAWTFIRQHLSTPFDAMRKTLASDYQIHSREGDDLYTLAERLESDAHRVRIGANRIQTGTNIQSNANRVESDAERLHTETALPAYLPARSSTVPPLDAGLESGTTGTAAPAAEVSLTEVSTVNPPPLGSITAGAVVKSAAASDLAETAAGETDTADTDAAVTGAAETDAETGIEKPQH